MTRKLELLQILASTVCPICQQDKAAQGWTCLTCGKPHRASAEHATLAQTCQAHMLAADQYLAVVERGR